MTDLVEGPELPGGSLIELSVVLVASANNPSLLNADFLRYNGIVGEGSEVSAPPVTTPAFSQVQFGNGITVTVDPQRVIFVASDSAGCLFEPPQIARRYIEKVPHVPYRAIGINPKFFCPVADSDSALVSALRDDGRWMRLDETMPTVGLQVVYEDSDRRISLDIKDATRSAGGAEQRGRLFQANVHRDAPQTDQPARMHFIETVLDGWKSDLSAVRRAISRFMEGSG